MTARPCRYSNEPVFPADRQAERVACPRCGRVDRHFGDRSLPRYPRHSANVKKEMTP